jgi:hypothetical protein
VGVGRASGIDDVFFRPFNVTISDVVFNRIIKKDGLLCDDGDLTA